MNRQDIIDKIKTDLPCTDYLTRSKGGLYCCPVCGSGTGEKHTGAVKYYRDTNTWYCHRCYAGGDVLDAIQAAQEIDFNSALQVGAQALGLTLPGQEAAERSIKSDRASSLEKDHSGRKTAQEAPQRPTEAPADYTAYYESCAKLLKTEAAINYLKGRGISYETAAAHGIGYDPEADPANRPGAAPGVFKPHPAQRLIIPTSPSHYVGRSIDGNEYSKVNAKGSRPGIFNQAAIYTGGVVFVTEGAFDALSIAEAGGKAIALNSAGNGNLLIEQLQRQPAERPTKFVVCYDVDKDPATNARTRKEAAELVNELQALDYESIDFDISPYLQEGAKDVNDILRHDKEQVRAMLEAAELQPCKDDLQAFFEKIQTEAYRPYQTGLSFFDDVLGDEGQVGVVRQSLLLLMAAPGTGKTTLCLQLALELAKRKKPVLYLNFEMSNEQMLAKALSYNLSRHGHSVTATDILQGYAWTIDQLADVQNAINDYRQNIYPYLKYNPGMSGDLEQLQKTLTDAGEKAKATGKDAPAVIVDYLHLISSSKGLESQEIIKQAVEILKRYAIDYHTTVIGIVAVNRESMKKGQLSISSGRDSSAIEYTADYILTLNYYDVDQGVIDPQNESQMSALRAEPCRRMIIRVPKNRMGAAGKCAKIYFNPKENYFIDGDFIPPGAKPFAPSFDTRRRL